MLARHAELRSAIRAIVVEAGLRRTRWCSTPVQWNTRATSRPSSRPIVDEIRPASCRRGPQILIARRMTCRFNRRRYGKHARPSSCSAAGRRQATAPRSAALSRPIRYHIELNRSQSRSSVLRVERDENSPETAIGNSGSRPRGVLYRARWTRSRSGNRARFARGSPSNSLLAIRRFAPCIRALRQLQVAPAKRCQSAERRTGNSWSRRQLRGHVPAVDLLS